MTQNATQDVNKLTQKDTPPLDLPFIRCAVPGHSDLELKWIPKKEYPNISHIYCPVCILETIEYSKLPELQLVNLDDVFKDTINLSHKYMADLEPVMTQLQAKQEQLTKNDFKNMFQSVLLKRGRFRKTIQRFKMEVASLCQKYEEFFEKQLEQSFYQSFFAIDSRLSSFKDTYEVMRLRLSSYNQELEKTLKIAQDVPQFCEGVSTILKDLNSLKSNKLLRLMKLEIEDFPVNSEIAENFHADCAIENELSTGLNSALKALNKKMEDLQNGVTETQKKSNKEDKEGRKIWPDPADESIEVFEREIAKFFQGDLVRKLSGGSEARREEEDDDDEYDDIDDEQEEKDNYEVINNNVRNKKKEASSYVENNRVKEVKEAIRKHEKNGIKRNNFEEIKGKIQESLETVDSDENYVSEDDENEEDDGELHKELIYQLKNSVQPEIFRKLFKSRKYLRKSDRHLRLGLVKFSQTVMDENNKREDSEDSKEERERERERNTISFTIVNKDKDKDKDKDKGKQQAIPPTIIANKQEKELVVEEKPKKPTTVAAPEDTREKVIIEPRDTRESLESFEMKRLKNKMSNKYGKRKTKTTKIDPLINFISQLRKEIGNGNPKTFEKLHRLVSRIKLTSTDKNKRILVSDILSIQDFIGEFLRQNNQSFLQEYRKQRRQLKNNDEATKYNYVCRDFFIKYYNHYKNIKSLFLDELGVSKQAFNNDYRYWVEHGHSYLAWSRFKSKIQKASIDESKHIIKEADLKGILNQLLYFLKEPLGEFTEEIKKTKKKERYLLVELLLARIFDRVFFAFQIEEEDIMASLRAVSLSSQGKEALKLYEEFETIVANVMYPGLKVQVSPEEESQSQ